MKKRIQYALLFITIMAVFLSGRSSQDSSPENTPDNASDTSSSVTYDQYAGTWAQEEIGWLYGGVILDISVNADVMNVAYLEVTAAPISDEAEIDISVSLADIQDNRIEADFDNDGWGNAGTLRITFDNDQVLCKISDVHYIGEDGAPIWGATETTSVLVRMDSAHELLGYSLDDYYEMFPDENPDNWEGNGTATMEPGYDTSKASGILANLGLTEEEFRESCTPLQTQSRPYVVNDTQLLDEIQSYPAQYSGQFFRFYKFNVDNKGVTDDGYLYYIGVFNGHVAQVFDLRDDAYSPTISKNDVIEAYVIFSSVQLNGLGQDVLCFTLISCDK